MLVRIVAILTKLIMRFDPHQYRVRDPSFSNPSPDCRTWLLARLLKRSIAGLEFAKSR